MRGTCISRLLFTSAIYAVALLGIGIPTASAAVQNRIANVISNSRSVEVPDSVHPRVRLANDLGPAPGETKLVGMSLRFTPSVAQQAALDQLLVDQQNPASPLYHQWLTPQQYAVQFGLSSTDLAKVTAWLTSEGFTVTGVAQGGTFVTFNGTIAQAQTAFSTSIHSLVQNGESHFANVTNASVPSALGGVVGSITGLNDFHFKPRVRASIVKPNFTSSVSGSHFIAPGDVYTIYDMNPLLTTAINGTGITIAVTGQVNLYNTGTTNAPVYADVIAFRSASGLSTSNLPTTVVEPTAPVVTNNCSSSTSSNCPSPNLDDLDESSIDVQWSGAMAPAATILFVNGPDVFYNSMTQAIDQKLAPIITTSYGNCEAAWGSSFLNMMNQLFKQANAQGQTILAAAGDDGATDCDAGPSATEGLAVDFPASSPFVTAMGGTMFNGDAGATGSGSTWGTTQYWKGTSGSDVISSAISYIPEAAWNDASSGYFGGGGGGASAFFPKPAWQVENGAAGMTTTLVPADASRDVPDISLDASNEHDPFLYCLQGSCGNGFRIVSGSNAGNLTVAGGTSFDSQIFGGMLALIEQKTGSTRGLGNINPTLYAMGNSTAYYSTASTSVFHDITTGNNAMWCTQGSVDCPVGGSIGYNSGTGYDLATGWGSVDLYNLANAWNLVTPLSAGTVAPNLSATSLSASPNPLSGVASGVTVMLTATVTSASSGFTTTPTGSVQFLANNVALGAPVALPGGSGVATYQWTTSCSMLGQQSLSASYSGDANYQGSVGPALATNGSSYPSPLIVTVNSTTCPSFTLTPASSSITVASGGTIPTVAITVAPVNGFTGSVVFSATATSTTGYTPTFSFSPQSVNISSTASGSTTLTLAGITASLHLSNAPGEVDSGTMFAQQKTGRMPASTRPASTLPWTAAGSGIVIASLLMLVLPRKRRLGGLLLLALSVALVGGATGCGASSQAAAPTTNSYYVTVMGTYTSTANAVVMQSTSVVYQIQ